MFLHLFRISLFFLSAKFCSFQCSDFALVKFISKYFFLFDIVKGTVFSILFSDV